MRRDRDPVELCVRGAALLAVTVLCTIAALAMMSGLDSREPGALELLSTPLNILVLGDSSADVGDVPPLAGDCSDPAVGSTDLVDH